MPKEPLQREVSSWVARPQSHVEPAADDGSRPIRVTPLRWLLGPVKPKTTVHFNFTTKAQHITRGTFCLFWGEEWGSIHLHSIDFMSMQYFLALYLSNLDHDHMQSSWNPMLLIESLNAPPPAPSLNNISLVCIYEDVHTK